MPSEAAIERACATYLLSKGGWLVKQQGTAGFPDRLALLPNGKHFLVEFKRPGGEMSPMQRFIMARLKGMGHECFEVDNTAMFRMLVNERL